MTIEETKDLLKSLRSKRRQYITALERVKLLEQTITSVGLTASYEANGSKGSSLDSPTERAVLRLLEAKERLKKAVDEYLDIEDRIAEALDDLTDEEREVIVERYMNSKTIAQIAGGMFFSRETVNRRLCSAQKKMSKTIS